MVKKQVKFLKALSDTTRFKIILFLLDGKKSVSDITHFVKKAQPTVSLHLRVLELSSLVKPEKKGRQTFYKISDRMVFRMMEALGKK